MDCKNCIYFYIESKDRIVKDPANGDAGKYSCRKKLYSLYTEKQLEAWMNKRKYCYPKMESRISLGVSIIALLITVFFPIWQTCDDKRHYIKKEDVDLIKQLIALPDEKENSLTNDSVNLKINNIILNVETLRVNTLKSSKMNENKIKKRNENNLIK